MPHPKRFGWIPLLLAATLTVHAEIPTPTDLTHTIERSRVLSMRIIKAHALLGLNSRFKNPDKELEESYQALNNNLIDIHTFLQKNPSGTNDQLLMLIEKAQQNFAMLKDKDLLHDIDPKRAIDFFKALEKSRVQINKAAEILTKETAKRDPVFYTTRLSTIAQKMAAVYLYKTWGIALPKLDEHFAMMTRKSGKSIKALNQFAQQASGDISAEQKKEIEQSIQAMKDQLTFFIMARKFKHFIPSLLYNKANTIEDENDKIEGILVR